eukprot:GHRQ01033506.1.p1 GENE.GHRQ01033506.1~~GHRQ01033506.1.p1  ORF type:complete len:238 (-),score=36.78 GHRQ01033506.1:102-761(-)
MLWFGSRCASVPGCTRQHRRARYVEGKAHDVAPSSQLTPTINACRRDLRAAPLLHCWLLAAHTSACCAACSPYCQAFRMLVTDKQKLDGLESSTLAVAAQKAKAAGHKNATTEHGPWLLTLDFSTYAAIMAFAKDRALRKTAFTTYKSLASSGKTDNTPIIRLILEYRREFAGLMGYPNYAEQSFSTKVGMPLQVHTHVCSVHWILVYVEGAVSGGGSR